MSESIKYSPAFVNRVGQYTDSTMPADVAAKMILEELMLREVPELVALLIQERQEYKERTKGMASLTVDQATVLSSLHKEISSLKHAIEVGEVDAEGRIATAERSLDTALQVKETLKKDLKQTIEVNERLREDVRNVEAQAENDLQKVHTVLTRTKAALIDKTNEAQRLQNEVNDLEGQIYRSKRTL